MSSIDLSLVRFEEIVTKARAENDRIGYFAGLYHIVTQSVHKVLQERGFNNNENVERLTVLFADRYFRELEIYRAGEENSQSWSAAFQLNGQDWPLVLHHLLTSINAHIGLDLGIVTAQVCEGESVEDFRADFDHVNSILSGLVDDVKSDLEGNWPILGFIFSVLKRLDNALINFSTKIARDDAWAFAVKLHSAPSAEHSALIKERDAKVGGFAKKMVSAGYVMRLVFKVFRALGRKSVSDQIQALATRSL